MSDYPWFRMYNETLNDPKLKRIGILTKQPKALINGVWMGLLCLASESPIRGKLLISQNMPYMIEEIIEAVGVEFEIGELIIDHLIKLELMSLVDGVYSISQWDNRQFKSDSSVERVRAYRERQASKKNKGSGSSVEGNGNDYYPKRYRNVTSNGSETPQDTESDTDIDTDKERESRTQDSERQRECRNAMLSVCYAVDSAKQATPDQQKWVVEAFADIDRLFKPTPDEFQAFQAWWWGDRPPTPKQVLNDWSKFKANPEPKRKDIRNESTRTNSSQRSTTSTPRKIDPYKNNGKTITPAGLPIDPDILAKFKQQSGGLSQ